MVKKEPQNVMICRASGYHYTAAGFCLGTAAFYTWLIIALVLDAPRTGANYLIPAGLIAAFDIPAILLVIRAFRWKLSWDGSGMWQRTLFGETFVPWNNVCDFYLRPSPKGGERSPFVVVVLPRRRMSLYVKLWSNLDDLMDAVSENTDTTFTTRWEFRQLPGDRPRLR